MKWCVKLSWIIINTQEIEEKQLTNLLTKLSTCHLTHVLTKFIFKLKSLTMFLKMFVGMVMDVLFQQHQLLSWLNYLLVKQLRKENTSSNNIWTWLKEKNMMVQFLMKQSSLWTQIDNLQELNVQLLVLEV